MKITPGWQEGPLLAARLCTKKRWFGTATRIGERGLRRAPKALPLRLLVADSYLASRDLEDALRHSRVLIAADPNGFDGFHLACESLQLLGRPDEAIALLEEGLDRCTQVHSASGKGRSRHVQRHVQAYLKRDWYPLYYLWRDAVLAPAQGTEMDVAAGELRVKPQAFQYWSQGALPEDVQALTARWNELLRLLGLAPVRIFSQRSARAWIVDHQPDFLVSFDSAPHYAAESDVFRLAYAMSGDVFWIDSDLMPAEQASTVLNMALRQDSTLLFLKRKAPYIQSSAFIARAGCPFFAAMGERLKGFDYGAPEWAEVSRLHLIHDYSFGPATYAQALEQLCAQQGPAIPCHDQSPLLQKMHFPGFSLSFFSGERLVVGAGKNLAYKRSSDNWKVWARR